MFIGIDIGTTGIRACCIDNDGIIHSEHSIAHADTATRYPRETALQWRDNCFRLIRQITADVNGEDIEAIAIDGTSGSVLLLDEHGAPVSDILMYNDASSVRQAEAVAAVAPESSAAHGVTSSLAKALQLFEDCDDAAMLCHQSDWLNSCLTPRFGVTDYNNALKSGYDAENMCWPEWLNQLPLPQTLYPEVIAPGETIGRVDADIAATLRLNPKCRVVAGTTDSIAAFIATGASKIGDAVTTLGSTLVIKLLSSRPIYAKKYGIYSHRYHADDNLWLVGGASNCGCRVFEQLFTPEQIDAMSEQLQPEKSTGLHYYPLPVDSKGDRFPVNDPDKLPELEPRPDDDVAYFQGLLESLATVEHQAYTRLMNLGCNWIKHVYTAGGGSRNQSWNSIRQYHLQIPVTTAEHTEACYGAALLARNSKP